MMTQIEQTLQITWDNQLPAELLTQVGEWLENTAPHEAYAYYEAALSIDSSYSLAAWRCGSLALKQQNYTYAVNKIEQSLRLLPDHAPSYYLLGKAYFGVKDYYQSLECSEKTLLLNPQHSGACSLKVSSLAALHKWKDLISYARSSFNHVEQPGETRMLLALALAHNNQIDEAIETYSFIPIKFKKRFLKTAQEIEDITNS